MKNSQQTILNDVDTGSVTGAAQDSGQTISASFQIVCGDATAEGTVKIQASNDNPAPSGGRIGSTFVPTNWSDIPNATSTVASGVGPLILIPVMSFSYIRAVYTRSSGGSSTIQVNMNQQSV